NFMGESSVDSHSQDIVQDNYRSSNFLCNSAWVDNGSMVFFTNKDADRLSDNSFNT
ncbi:9199_t:CDS:1, partial [Racocetra persica]